MAKWTIKPEVTKVFEDRILWSDMNYEQKSDLKYCKDQGQVIEWSSKLYNGKWDQWETCPPKYLWITAPFSGLAYRVKPTEVVEHSPDVEKDQCEDNTMTEHYCVDCGGLVDDNGKCCRGAGKTYQTDVGGERREYEEDKGVPFNPVDRPVYHGQGKIKSDGGPSGYFDLRNGGTLNNELEYKGDTQWLGDSFHLGNVVKLAWRWGIKSGTDKSYDANKLMYSGARLYMKYAGVAKLRKALQKMLDDQQFQIKEDVQ
jgi:hypothetical protein